MQKRSFSYAEAMVTMLIVAIIMVATTPIISKKINASKKSSVWAWTADTISTYFGTSSNQRVIIGSNTADKDSARLIIHEAEDGRETTTTLPPLLRFEEIDSNTEIGRLITNNTSLGLGFNVLNAMPLTGQANNTALGAKALYQATSSNNTAIGYNACSSIITGDNNICIGNEVIGTNGTSNGLYIGSFISGNSVDGYTLTGSIKFDASNTPEGFSGQTLKSILEDINQKAESSDLRLKNVQGLSNAGLNEINKIVVKNYTFKKDKKKTPHVGVIAQELRNVFPNSVTKGDDGYLKINKDEMFYAMLNSIKELSAKFVKQDEHNKKMEQEIEALKQENLLLKQKLLEFEQKLNQK